MSDALAKAGSMEAAVQALIDRQAIEEMCIDYFSGGIRSKGFEHFFDKEFELDINGIVTTGFDDVRDLYRRVMEDKPRLTGTFRMILSNFLIEVDGDKATAQFMWTQTLNDTIKGPPRFIEQGREYDRLVKREGQWKITKRVVIANSGLPDMFDDTWEPRLDYQLPAE